MVVHGADVALCSAACIVWSNNNVVSQAQRCLALAIINYRANAFGMTSFGAYSLPLQHAQWVLEQVTRQSGAAYETSLSKLLSHNAFMDLSDTAVSIKWSQLLKVALSMVSAQGQQNEQASIAETLAASMVAELGLDDLSAHTLDAIFTQVEMLPRGIKDILSYGSKLLADVTDDGVDAPQHPQPPTPQLQPQQPVVSPPQQQEAEEHWPLLPAAVPRPLPLSASSSALGAAPRPPATAPARGGSMPGASALLLPMPAGLAATAAAAADDLAGDEAGWLTVEGGAGASSVATAGLRATLGVGWGDDEVLWPTLMGTVQDLLSSRLMPAEGEDLHEVLALCLACCTVFPANNGANVHRLIMAMAIICCPPDIARINQGRHSCLHKFLVKTAGFSNKRLVEWGISRSDLADTNHPLQGDPFFTVTKDPLDPGNPDRAWANVKLMQIAAIAVQVAEAPHGTYPNLPYPPTLAHLHKEVHHNQAKPVFELLQRLLQPNTRMAFALACLDVLKRHTCHEPSESAAVLLRQALNFAARRSATPTWPPPLLKSDAVTSLNAAVKDQRDRLNTRAAAALLARYKQSTAPPMPPPLPSSGAGAAAVRGKRTHYGAGYAQQQQAGIVGGEFIDEQKQQQRKPAPAPSAAGGKGRGGGSKGLVGAQAAEQARLRRKQEEAERRACNAFQMLEEIGEDYDDGEQKEEGDDEAAGEEEEAEGEEDGHRGLSNGADAGASSDKYHQLLAMAGLLSTSEDDMEPDEPQPHQRPAATAPAATYPTPPPPPPARAPPARSEGGAAPPAVAVAAVAAAAQVAQQPKRAPLAPPLPPPALLQHAAPTASGGSSAGSGIMLPESLSFNASASTAATAAARAAPAPTSALPPPPPPPPRRAPPGPPLLLSSVPPSQPHLAGVPVSLDSLFAKPQASGRPAPLVFATPTAPMAFSPQQQKQPAQPGGAVAPVLVGAVGGFGSTLPAFPPTPAAPDLGFAPLQLAPPAMLFGGSAGAAMGPPGVFLGASMPAGHLGMAPPQTVFSSAAPLPHPAAAPVLHLPSATAFAPLGGAAAAPWSPLMQQPAAGAASVPVGAAPAFTPGVVMVSPQLPGVSAAAAPATDKTVDDDVDELMDLLVG